MSILGLSKEAVADVLEIFDSELLALSRLDSPNIVKVYLVLLYIDNSCYTIPSYHTVINFKRCGL